jgi:hypothetical protein
MKEIELSSNQETAQDSAAQPSRSRSRVLVLVALATTMTGFASSATAAAIVTGKQIKDETIVSRDLRDRSITGANVKDESLTQADFAFPVVGPPGDKGLQGQTGPRGSLGLQYEIEPLAIPANSARTWGATCPAGTRAISGGGSTNAAGIALLSESAPLDDSVGWWVGVRNKTGQSITGYAWALCVTASS